VCTSQCTPVQLPQQQPAPETFRSIISFMGYFMTLGALMTDEWHIGKDLEGSGNGLIMVLQWHLPGRMEEKCEKHHNVLPMLFAISSANLR
jgi:hypothetical protein